MLSLIELFTSRCCHMKSRLAILGRGWWSPSQVIATSCCVCSVCMHCLSANITAHLGNTVIFHHLSPLALYVTEISCKATPLILLPSAPETVLIQEINLWNTAAEGKARNPSPLTLQANAARPQWILEGIAPPWGRHRLGDNRATIFGCRVDTWEMPC